MHGRVGVKTRGHHSERKIRRPQPQRHTRIESQNQREDRVVFLDLFSSALSRLFPRSLYLGLLGYKKETDNPFLRWFVFSDIHLCFPFFLFLGFGFQKPYGSWAFIFWNSVSWNLGLVYGLCNLNLYFFSFLKITFILNILFLIILVIIF